jgi:hypothetical protein
MKRWHARLQNPNAIDEHHVDDFGAFFVVCFHLRDWLQADETLDKAVGRVAEKIVNRILWLKLCADIANGSKHLKIDKHVRFDAASQVLKVEAAFQPDAFQPDAFQTAPEVIVYADGGVWSARTVADNCVATWDMFLKERGLL